jgi:glycine/D-amino acid oxidase-like deaminating enzyme
MNVFNQLPSERASATSWWFEDVMKGEHDAPKSPPLIGEIRVDVAIVGGGFTGLWTALALRKRNPNLTITLIEASLCGSGASGANGGKVGGYWASLQGMVDSIGEDGALAVARAGTRAQDAIRAFATDSGRDVGWKEGGSVRVSAAPAQDRKIAGYTSQARRLGVADTVIELTPEQIAARCSSPVFRGGVFFPEGASVHPARLARALRIAAIEAGVSLFEHTPMISLDKGAPNRILTPKGQIIARDIVLATNVGLATEPEIKPHVSVFSSYALMTEPAPECLKKIGWIGNEGFADLRMFLHYFRKTPDGRVLMGSGSGPISYGGNTIDSSLRHDKASAERAERGLRRLLPTLAGVAIAKTWGGPIDVSADHLPIFRTFPGTRVHYGCGYSGHGVNPSYIGGQCLASLVLGVKDEWSTLPLCTRHLPSLPPDPFRTIGARAIRWGIVACEEAQENEQQGSILARSVAQLPRFLGLRIGIR